MVEGMAMSRPVLIGFGDALAGIESAWCLAADGFEVHAFSRLGSRPALTRSRSVRVIEVTPPEENATECAAQIAALAREIRPVAVLPLDDHAVWLCDRAFSDHPSAIVAGPTGRLAVLALEKREQLKLAETVGFAVPPTTQLTVPAMADSITRPTGRGPWVVKPALAVEVRGATLQRPSGRIATRPEQVPGIAAAIGGPVLIQPLIDGVGEGVFGLAIRGVATALSSHRRIRMMNPRGSGSSACRSAPVATDVVDPVRDLIKQSGWHGLFMIELLRDGANKPWFMELNGRAWGSMALARHRGYAYPTWAVRASIDTKFQPTEPVSPPEVTARHLGREIVHLGTVLARGGAPRLATLRHVLTVRSSDRWYNYRPGEASVFIADALATVSSQVAPRISQGTAKVFRRSR
jgi:predicted ATP-grasp superfamily ATP-dependent carboligase